MVELTVELLPDGEVSPYLVQEVRVGDGLEVRGPVGGHFVWEQPMGGPLLLIAGGSGMVPLRAILRHHRHIYSSVPVRLLYSARDIGDVIYHDELMALATSDEIDVSLTLTRTAPTGWHGYARRVDRPMLADVAWPSNAGPLAYICGPTSFVETVSGTLVDLGYDSTHIRTERFGGTGDPA